MEIIMESKIKASELRIGNWFHYLGNNYQSTGVLYKSTYYQPLLRIDERLAYYEDIEPIELTEQVLLKCGAEIFPNLRNALYDRFKLIWKEEYKYWHVLDRQTDVYLNKIEYLHEWQNFVFVMNGQELTFIP